MSKTGDPAGPVLPPSVTVGRRTYGHVEETFRIFVAGSRIEVGGFCSIAPDVKILAGANHFTSRVTSFPLNSVMFDREAGNEIDVVDDGPTIVGNDVWIGLGATILPGVIIGDGAVIGAQSVISKSVPPYAVVVGSPARIVRYRFDARTRRRLQAVAWWTWSDEDICAFRTWFSGDVETFLDQAEQTHAARAEAEQARRLREIPTHLLTPLSGPADTLTPIDSLGAAEARIAELDELVNSMRGTQVWQWGTRFWRLRAHLGLRRPARQRR